jgi:hypothetical protein
VVHSTQTNLPNFKIWIQRKAISRHEYDICDKISCKKLERKLADKVCLCYFSREKNRYWPDKQGQKGSFVRGLVTPESSHDFISLVCFSC